MKSFVTPHSHPQSLDSGSTLDRMIARHKALGTGYATMTDHGTLEAAIDWYQKAKKAKLKPILGLEGYFRDDQDPILQKHGLIQPKRNKKGEIQEGLTTAAYNKYYHITMHFMDQEAYLTGVKRLSNAALNNTESHGFQSKPLFVWNDLEEIGGKNSTMCSSCLVGLIGRHVMSGRLDIAEEYYQKLRSIPKASNFYVEVFPHQCTHNWVNKVWLYGADGQKLSVYPGKKLKLLNEENSIEAKDLAKQFARDMAGRVVLEDGFEIAKAEHITDFFQNEESPLAPGGDPQLGANRFIYFMAKKYGDKILISDDSHFATPEEHKIQDIRLGNGTENWKFYNSYHMMQTADVIPYFKNIMNIADKEIEEWVDNSYEWASKFDSFELKFPTELPTSFYPGDTKARTYELVAKHGRYDPTNEVYKKQLEKEISVLADNGTLDLLPYFFPLEEVVDKYHESGMLTGPARGSAGGSLLAYLLGITHIDPIKYKLSFERFLTIDRIKAGTLPDIDQDLEDRGFLVGPDGNNGWLHERFGADHIAQISTGQVLRLKSAIKDTHRALYGEVSPEIEELCKALPTPPQGISDYDFIFGKYDEHDNAIDGIEGIYHPDDPEKSNPALLKYGKQYPKEWDMVQQLLSQIRSRSRHACGYIIMDKPVSDLIPLVKINDIPCTQYTAKGVEFAGALKTDFLVVNSLKDIRACISLIHKNIFKGMALPESMIIDGRKVPRIRLVPVKTDKGFELADIWNLPEDQAVFRDICEGKTETVFQLSTNSALIYLTQFMDSKGNHLIRSVEDISTFTALDRPGPLDYKIGNTGRNMLDEFIARKKGDVDKNSEAYVQYLVDTIPETLGVLTFQESLQYVVQDLAGFDPLRANQFRICVGKKKKGELADMKPEFIAGASKKVDLATAERIWSMMVTFGQYGFNKSHSVAYSCIAYACAFLKHHYPLEWWAGVLQHADKNEIGSVFLKYCKPLLATPDINLSDGNFTIKDDRIIPPISMIDGIGPKAHESIVANRPYADIQDFLNKVNRRAVNSSISMKLIYSGAMDSLFPKDFTTPQKLQAYIVATGDKKLKIPSSYLTSNPLHRYAVRKSVMPTYTAADGSTLMSVFLETMGLPVLTNSFGLVRTIGEDLREFVGLKTGSDVYKLINSTGFQEIEQNQDRTGKFALVCYVADKRNFAYSGKTKEAIELIFDVDGYIGKAVRWPGFEDNKASLDFGIGFEKNVALKKSIVVLYISRNKPNKPFNIEHVRYLASIEDKEL